MQNHKEELKPKTFRISDEVAEQIKNIIKELDGNSQQAFVKLLEAYEFQAGKVTLTEKKDDIEKFENYTSCLIRMYMASLEDYQNAKELIRTEFDNELKSKDKIIQDLQEKLELSQQSEKKMKDSADTAEKLLKQATEEVHRLQKEIDKQHNNYEKQLQALTESKLSLTNLCANLNQQLSDSENIKNKLHEMEALKNEISRLTKQISEMEFAHRQALFEYKEQMQQEQMAYLREITELQKENKNLLLDHQQKLADMQQKKEKQNANSTENMEAQKIYSR